MTKATSHSFPTFVSRLLVLFSTCFNIASSAAISLPHSNLTTNSVANRNQCTDNPTWKGTGSSSIDCIGAVQKLYNAEVKSFSDIDFEFLSERAPARSLPSMRTPRKYTVGRSSPKYCDKLPPLSLPIKAEPSQRIMYPRHRNVELFLRRRATGRSGRTLRFARRDVFL